MATNWGTPLAGTKVLNASTDMENTGTTASPNGSTNEGDAMVAVCSVLSDFDHIYLAVTGWTLICTVINFHGSDTTLAIYVKYAGASEGSSTFKTDRDNDSPPNFAQIYTFPGGDLSTLMDVTYAVGDHVTLLLNGASPNVTPHDPITTAEDNAMVVCVARMNDNDAMTAVAVATGYTELGSEISDNDNEFIVQYKIVETAGVETPGAAAWTHDGFLKDTTFITIALRGAAPASGLSIPVAMHHYKQQMRF